MVHTSVHVWSPPVSGSGVSCPATVLLAAYQSSHFYSTVFYGKEIKSKHNPVSSQETKQ